MNSHKADSKASSTHKEPAIHWPIWLFFWLAISVFWFVTLGLRDLIHPDEGRYAELSLEMLQSGDWITPRLNGLLYFEKPAANWNEANPIGNGRMGAMLFGEPDTDSITLFTGYYILTYTNLLISLKIYKNGRKRNY